MIPRWRSPSRSRRGGCCSARRRRTCAAAASPQLTELVTQDASGLAASALEGVLPTAAARAELVSNELAAAETDAPAEAVRALRFRLAHHYEADGRFAEALAALTPLRSEGDPLARAWSYELARRSGEAILEVAILSEETRASDDVLGDEAAVPIRARRGALPGGRSQRRRRRLPARDRRPLAAGRPRSTPRWRWFASPRATGRQDRRRSRTRWASWRRRAPRTRRWRRPRRARRRCCARPPGERSATDARGDVHVGQRRVAAARARGHGGAQAAVGGAARRARARSARR